MDKFVESIKKIMIEDKEKILLNKNIEELYIWELADKWIDMNIKDQKEFEQKLQALGSILNDNEFQEAIDKSALALKNNNFDKGKEIAELIRKITQTKEYIESSKICGYKILSKYEEPDTYKTDSFIVHTNIMVRLYKYLNEKLSEIKGEKYGE